MAQILVVIPARYGASRFPGKPLAPILGKPMLQWVVEGVSQSQMVSQVLIATDHPEIADLANILSVNCVMTDSKIETGSDRVWQAVQGRSEEMIINVQGDEPLIHGEVIDQLAQSMLAQPQWDMMTLGRKMDKGALQSETTAKIILNAKGEALYFSRFPIPFSRNRWSPESSGCLKHIGIYGYRRDFLERFCLQSSVEIEKAEGLEQLRALYMGARIPVVEVNYQSWGVDVPSDIDKVEKILKERYGSA